MERQLETKMTPGDHFLSYDPLGEFLAQNLSLPNLKFKIIHSFEKPPKAQVSNCSLSQLKGEAMKDCNEQREMVNGKDYNHQKTTAVNVQPEDVIKSNVCNMSRPKIPQSLYVMDDLQLLKFKSALGIKTTKHDVNSLHMDDLGFTYRKDYSRPSDNITVFLCTLYRVSNQSKVCNARVHANTGGDCEKKKILRVFEPHTHPSPIYEMEELISWRDKQIRSVKKRGVQFIRNPKMKSSVNSSVKKKREFCIKPANVTGSYVKNSVADSKKDSKKKTLKCVKPVLSIPGSSSKSSSMLISNPESPAHPCIKNPYSEELMIHQLDDCVPVLDTTPKPSIVPVSTIEPVLDLTLNPDTENGSKILPIWSNCRICKSVVLIPSDATSSSLMFIGSEHIMKYHKSALLPGQMQPHEKLISDIFPEFFKASKDAVKVSSGVCTPYDISEHRCDVCGETQLMNMPEDDEGDCELINHANKHVKQGDVLSSELFWRCYPSTGPRYPEQVIKMEIFVD